jgi:hypothetical protein
VQYRELRRKQKEEAARKRAEERAAHLEVRGSAMSAFGVSDMGEFVYVCGGW